ncbi:MAG: DUF1926 domain-containing protein [Planctomycetes bacterium]|nr:DUF1926 domain-containing protein [Planctomycetota bacterium]
MGEKRINLAMAIHNHQPVGNFPHVFEMAYQKSYLPFLDEFEKHTTLKTTLHYSGCLLEWIESAHPEYFKRLSGLVAGGRVELMGGGFYEPILVMLPDEDRHDQIQMMTDYLKTHFKAAVKGAWVPERVWEQPLCAPLVDGGVRYIILDDFHFKNAGLSGEDLLGYYTTEDRGRVLAVFPSSELLRYYIPFRWPEELVEHLKGIATEDGDRLLVYGDDGEKFGVWPETYEHVYGDHWLERFFKALEENADWIHLMTLSEALDHAEPIGRIYLPDASYREMTEWALPVPAQERYEAVATRLEKAGLYDEAKPFMRGGFWRNFKVKYPETNRMYGKMLHVSRKVREMKSSRKKSEAQRELFRGQCNCAYWHGVFGGLYLPHLRWAVYEHLVAAERIADGTSRKQAKWAEIEALDLDLDGKEEIALSNSLIKAVFKPDTGGHMVEFDVRDKGVNFLSVVARRKEAYHAHLLEAAQADDDGAVKSIHHITATKQPGLDKKLWYDAHTRDSLVDYFFPQDFSLEDAVEGKTSAWGDFAQGSYEAGVSRAQDAVVLSMLRSGLDHSGSKVEVAKTVRVTNAKAGMDVIYGIRNTDTEPMTTIFGVEFNLAMLSSDESQRAYHLGEGAGPIPLTAQDAFHNIRSLAVRDRQLGVDVAYEFSVSCEVWVYPIQTVSQSESGFELVYQGSCIIPRWPIAIDPGKSWAVTIRKEVHPLA